MLTGAAQRRKGAAEPESEIHRPAHITILREVKVDSPVHRLWAGTKVLSVLGLSITLSYFPTWGTIGLLTGLLMAGTLFAHIPAGAWPRPPRWFWIVLLATAALTGASGGSPHFKVFGVRLGLGGIDGYGKFLFVGVVLLLAAALLGWTTPLGDIAPAMAQLLSPLRIIRVPVDEAATAIALCVRSLPLLVNEMRTLIAARRLRPTPERVGRSEIERSLDELIDIMVTALAVSVRRAGELAEAITARGGTGMIAARTRRPGRSDFLVLAIVGAACYLATLFPG